jgi:thiol-disulfide isomerase/thioredoxin
MAIFGNPEIQGIDAWINSKPLTLKKLKGKVVLIDFWTYTCINCIRTIPYIKEWYKKYAKLSLVIIGVHTPEFEFEKNLDNVKQAAKKFDLKYPIALDNDYQTWKSFSNRYWPAKYLFDKDGKLVYTHFGEGAYAETELQIREALKALGASKQLAKIKPATEPKPKMHFGTTPETYCGSSRNPGLGSSAVCLPDGTCKYIDPGKHGRDIIYLSGEWEQADEYLETQSEKPASIIMKYYGSEINLVIHPPKKAVEAKIYVDGKLKRKLKLDAPKMYNLNTTKSAETHELKLEFSSKGARCYAYTFG